MSTVSEQFDAATVDFYSSLAEQNLPLAGQVGWVLRTMRQDNVLDQAQCEMVDDCLQKLGRAGITDLSQHCKPVVNLAGIASVARVCVVAGPPHDGIVLQSFSKTTAKLVDDIGRKCLDSLTAIKSSNGSVSITTSSSTSLAHLQHIRTLFSEAARHINGLSGVGFPPSLVLQGIAPIIAACAERVVNITQHFQTHVKLQEWVTFSQTGGAPPRRARKAGMLVQEIIDPILNEASEICQEFAKFLIFVTDVDTNLRQAIQVDEDSIHQKNVVPNNTALTSHTIARESIQKIRETGQEIVVGYMMVEAYCVNRNLTTAVDIAVVDGCNHASSMPGDTNGSGSTSMTETTTTATATTITPTITTSLATSRQSPSISLVEESFFIFKLRFSRALNTLHVDAPRFILNRLQAALEEIILPEVQKLLSLESTLNVSSVTIDQIPSFNNKITNDAMQTADVTSELTSDFNATLNQLLDGGGSGNSSSGGGSGSGKNGNSNQKGNGNTTSSLTNSKKYPLASLLIAACSARKAQQHSEDFVAYVRMQFEVAFGTETLMSVEPMIDELLNVAKIFQNMHNCALEELASHMDDGIKDVIRSTTLLDGEKYELESGEEFHRREVNDLFAKKVIDHLHHETSLLQRCKICMATDDYSDLVRIVASHVSIIVEKVWVQMRVNDLGGLMMETDLRTLIDQISHKELEAGSVRTCFARLTALVWLVNLENPEALIEENTLHSSRRVLECLNATGIDTHRNEIYKRLCLRIDFKRDKIEKVLDLFFAQNG